MKVRLNINKAQNINTGKTKTNLSTEKRVKVLGTPPRSSTGGGGGGFDYGFDFGFE